MPESFESAVNEVTKYYIRKGESPKRAKNIAYAVVTNRYKRAGKKYKK
jgi:hypothetical protein